jgi:hypothetical protein
VNFRTLFRLRQLAAGSAVQPSPSCVLRVLCVNAFVFFLIAATLVAAPTAGQPKIELNSSAAIPREVEDTTEKAIVRDYGSAWSTMSRALSENRADLLGDAFVGVAQEKLTQKIAQQKAAGLRTRYVDRGHQLSVAFYSPEGSAMQLRDTAQVEIQYLDGDKVVGTENATAHYLVLMTVAEDRWKVRVLEAIPGR